MKKSPEKYTIISLSGIVIFLVIWFVISYFTIVPSFFLPSPKSTFYALYNLAVHGGLITDIGYSIFRIVIGFILSVCVAIPLGILFGVSRKSEAFLSPIIEFVRYIPPSAFIPLCIVWFGIGEISKILLIFLGVAPYLTLLVADAVYQTKNEFIDSAKTLGSGNWDIIMRVIIPSSLPQIWDGMRSMFGAAWTFVIIAEIVGSSAGLGHIIIESQRFIRTDNIFAGIITIGCIGLITDYLFKKGRTTLFSWVQ